MQGEKMKRKFKPFHEEMVCTEHQQILNDGIWRYMQYPSMMEQHEQLGTVKLHRKRCPYCKPVPLARQQEVYMQNLRTLQTC